MERRLKKWEKADTAKCRQKGGKAERSKITLLCIVGYWEQFLRLY